MGILLSCSDCGESNDNQPSPETRRREQREAAEKRQRELEARGVKDPEGLKRKKQRREEIERNAEQSNVAGDSNMRWQVS